MAEEKKEGAAGEAKKRKLIKGRHKSAIKRHRQNVKRQARNQSTISTLRTSMKKVLQAVRAKDATTAKASLQKSMSLLHRAAAKNIIHHRNASRRIARLSSLVSSLA